MILHGDALEVLRTLESESVDCCVTSPPYWGLRDYGHPGQLGLEPSLKEYISKLTEIFEEVRRVLKKTGTCWVNMGDSYNSANKGSGGPSAKQLSNAGSRFNAGSLKEKDLCGQPWRLAFALQDQGWYLRSDIIWHKPNPMPSSVTDRPTTAHEYIFLLTKSKRYFYDADAIAEPAKQSSIARVGRNSTYDGSLPYAMARPPTLAKGALYGGKKGEEIDNRAYPGNVDDGRYVDIGVNCRSVWSICPASYPEAHFATFPEEIPKRCILAGCPEGGVVLDPFLGSGTTGAVAKRLGRNFVGIELNEDYIRLAEKRIAGVTPSLFQEAS